MVYSAVKRSLNEVEYKQHAWIDDDPRGALVDGRYIVPARPYQVGDLIVLHDGCVVVSETFEGYDFHSSKPVLCFNTEALRKG